MLTLRRSLTFAVPLAVALAAPSLAHAAPAEAQPSAGGAAEEARTERPDAPPKPKEEEEDHVAYVAFSPFHLILPVVQLTGEFRVHRKIGVAVIGGYGSIRATDSDLRVSVYELGGQFVGYPVGHFDNGMQLGAQALFLGAATSTSSSGQTIRAEGQGLSLGAFVGYKLATKIGFSFNIQGGVQVLAMRAQANSTTGQSADAGDSAVAPLLALNLGWSF